MANTDTNLKAAKLCGHDAVERNSGGVLVPSEKETNYKINGIYQRQFDIFTNPADKIATVIALGEKDIFLAPAGGGKWIGMQRHASNHFGMPDELDELTPVCDTHTEALAAAVEAV